MQKRLFFSIPLPQEIRDEIGAVTDKLKSVNSDGGIAWVRPENLHITVRFLGDRDEKEIPALEIVGKKVAGHHIAGKLELIESLDAFPNRGQPSVVFVPVADNTTLYALVHDLDRCLEVIGIPKNYKPFHPHITVARMKNGEELVLPPVQFAVQRFSLSVLELVESILSDGGSRYSVLDSFPIPQ